MPVGHYTWAAGHGGSRYLGEPLDSLFMARVLRLTALVFLCPSAALAQTDSTARGPMFETVVSAADPRWSFADGAEHRVGAHRGRRALYLDGRATLRGSTFQDGVLSVDVALTGQRAFAGLTFRVRGGEAEIDAEEVYLRLHKSGQPDAVQYTPVYRGQSAWQLYREHQAAAALPAGEWTRLRVVVHGRKARVYLGDGPDPVAVVDGLRHGDGEGAVGLFSLFGAHFADLRFTPDPVPGVPAPSAAPSAEPAPGVVASWALSEARPLGEDDLAVYPDDLRGWTVAEAEPSGLLPIGRDRARRSEVDVAWARVDVVADEAGPRAFTFDYSDRAVVFLNGRPVAAGDNSFLSKGPFYRGDVGLGANTVYLDLDVGPNELLVAVAERANGWGLIGRFDDPSGLTVTAALP